MGIALPAVFEWTGVGVFALTGALAAARHRMDPFGFILLAIGFLGELAIRGPARR